MNPQHPHATTPDAVGSDRQPFSRRRLFEFGGAAAAMAAILAACGSDEADPGRVGLAPTTTVLPTSEVDDAVYLRTLQSLEYSILDVYERLAADGGLDGAAAAALERFTADHTEAAATLGTLVSEAGGEPFECDNPWYQARFFEPALNNVFGGEGPDGPIEPSDDIPRDSLALIHGLEALATSSALHFVPSVSTSALRSAIVALGADAARRTATASLLIHPGPGGYLAPELILADGGEVPESEATEPAETAAPSDTAPVATPIPKPYVISARFQQLTAVNIEVGSVNELGLRYKAAWETPADNAYIYHGLTCAA